MHKQVFNAIYMLQQTPCEADQWNIGADNISTMISATQAFRVDFVKIGKHAISSVVPK